MPDKEVRDARILLVDGYYAGAVWFIGHLEGCENEPWRAFTREKKTDVFDNYEKAIKFLEEKFGGTPFAQFTLSYG